MILNYHLRAQGRYKIRFLKKKLKTQKAEKWILSNLIFYLTFAHLSFPSRVPSRVQDQFYILDSIYRMESTTVVKLLHRKPKYKCFYFQSSGFCYSRCSTKFCTRKMRKRKKRNKKTKERKTSKKFKKQF